MPRPCNASPSACTSARRSQRSSRSWTRSSTAWLSGYARAKHSVSCSELSSLSLRQRARPQARRSRARSAALSGPKVSRSLASRRMVRARWETRRVLLTRASLFAGEAVLEDRAPTPTFLAIDSTRSGLIVLQFEQEIGVNTEARREIWHSRRVIKPISAGSLEAASFTLLESGYVAQAQSRQDACIRFDSKARHHFVNVHQVVVGGFGHDFSPWPDKLIQWRNGRACIDVNQNILRPFSLLSDCMEEGPMQ